MNSEGNRITVLISAFACEADEGSEPEVGWSWAHEMAKEVSVVVLTQKKNKERIGRWYRENPEVTERPIFEYLDLEKSWLDWKKKHHSFLLPYYVRWQWKAAEIEDQLIERHGIDLIHHVTFASFRYPIFWRKRPIIWGPVGGADNAPFRLLYRGAGFQAGTRELVRNITTWMSSVWLGTLSQLRDRVPYAFSCTPQTNHVIQKAGIQCEVMPTISIPVNGDRPPVVNTERGVVEFLYVGRLHHLKGVHLLIDALSKLPDGTFRLKLIGDGPKRGSLLEQVSKYGLNNEVEFVGQVPRSSLVDHYRAADVLVAPSLYESGGMTVLEAFQQGRPAIVLDCGGHAISVAEGCGIKVDAHQPANILIEELSEAMNSYIEDPEKIGKDGECAWLHLRDFYSWDHKRMRMLKAYRASLKKNIHE